MFQTIRKQIRPNTSVEFYSPEKSPNITKSILKHQFQNYILTGKQIDVVKEISEDGLTQTITILWESKQAQQEFVNDPVMQTMINDSESYRLANNITLEIVSGTEI